MAVSAGGERVFCTLREARHGTEASPQRFAGVTRLIAAADSSSSSSAVSAVHRRVFLVN
jgi:hypothetical protein